MWIIFIIQYLSTINLSLFFNANYIKSLVIFARGRESKMQEYGIA